MSPYANSCQTAPATMAVPTTIMNIVGAGLVPARRPEGNHEGCPYASCEAGPQGNREPLRE